MSRQRAGAAREAFGRAMTPPTGRTAARSDSEALAAAAMEGSEERIAAWKDAKADRPSKFTMLLDPGAAADFDALAVQLRRQLGRRVEKAVIIRTLIALAADDATLRHQLAAEITTSTRH